MAESRRSPRVPLFNRSIFAPPRSIRLSASALLCVLCAGWVAWIFWPVAIDQRVIMHLPDDGFRWITSSSELPRYPKASETPRPLGSLPFGDRAQVEIFARFLLQAPVTTPQAVLLPPSDGTANLFVNGVPQSPAGAAIPGAPTPGIAQRLWIVSPADFHQGANRIDILVADAKLRRLRGPIYLAPQATLEPIVVRAIGAIGIGQHIAWWLCVCAVAFNLIAFGVRAPPVHLAVAALSAAAATTVFDGAFGLGLGQFGPIAHQLLIAGMTLCLGTVIQLSKPRLPNADHRVDLAILCATFLLGIAGLIASGAGTAVDVWIGAAAVIASGAYAFRVVALATSLWSTPSAARAVPFGVLTGFGAVALILLVLGASGFAPSLPPFAEDFALLASIVALAALASGHGAIAAGKRLLAIVRARLDQAGVIRQQRARLDATTRALEAMSREAAILEERQRMARDVHDGIGGQLASLIAQVRLRRVSMEDVERALMGGLSELRLLVDSLDLVGGTLADALSALHVRLGQQAAAGGMALVWDQSEDLNLVVTEPRWILNLYRVIQEATSNALRHSGGDRITISIRRLAETSLTIRIEDNGTGFDPARATGGRGMANMTHRVEEAGGSIAIETGATGGACLRATIPIPVA